MRNEYQEELKQLELKMVAAEKFAKKLPLFAEIILEQKYTGNEEWIRFGDRYKQIPLRWGINRGNFDSETRRYITNYNKPHKQILFVIYINTISLFDYHYMFGLEEIFNNTPIFFYDHSNSTFYVADDQIEDLLEKLNDWYIKAFKEVKMLKNREKMDKLKAELDKLTSEDTP